MKMVRRVPILKKIEEGEENQEKKRHGQQW